MLDQLTNITYSNYARFNKPSPQPLSVKQKAAILASSAAGVGISVAGLAKLKGFSLNPARILKTPYKEWALCKYAPLEDAIQFKAPQIITVASGSVAGGFLGGVAVDKQNKKAKMKESLNQIFGNVIVPVCCVATGAMLYNKFIKPIENIMPQIKNPSTRLANMANKISKNSPNIFCTLLFLGTGIFMGNRASNLINEKLYNKKVDRNIKATDFAPHFDDLCMATTMMNEDSLFGSKLARIIPIALLVPGYETGIAQEK